MRIALAEIVVRFQDLKIEDGATVHYHTTFTRAPAAIPITFIPGPRLDPGEA